MFTPTYPSAPRADDDQDRADAHGRRAQNEKRQQACKKDGGDDGSTPAHEPQAGGAKPNGRSGSGCEISIDFTAPIGMITLRGSTPSSACGVKQKKP